MIGIIERGFAGHFICSNRCRYRRCTDVNGKYRVSTVGAFYAKPDDRKRTTIGCGRLFETMVFRLGKKIDKETGAQCVASWEEVDSNGYNTTKDADEGHEAMVQK